MDDWPSITLAISVSSGDLSAHIVVFRDEVEVWTWDVASCGESLGDWEPVRFEKDGGLPLSQVCGRCFEAVGGEQRTLAQMANT